MVSKITVFLVITVTSSVWSLKCYQCNSDQVRDCEPFNGDTQKPKDCIFQELCYSISINRADDQLIVSRGCYSSKLPDICKTPPDGIIGTIYNCMTCSEDACNSSSRLKSSLVVLSLLCVIRWVFI